MFVPFTIYLLTETSWGLWGKVINQVHPYSSRLLLLEIILLKCWLSLVNAVACLCLRDNGVCVWVLVVCELGCVRVFVFWGLNVAIESQHTPITHLNAMLTVTVMHPITNTNRVIITMYKHPFQPGYFAWHSGHAAPSIERIFVSSRAVLLAHKCHERFH